MTTRRSLHGTEQGPPAVPPLRRVLVVSNLVYQALLLQQLLGTMGRQTTLARDEEAGLAHLAIAAYDTVFIDVDLGYPAVAALVSRVRRDHPGVHIAILVGWWDAREADVRTYGEVVVYKPVHAQQLREALDRCAAWPRPGP